MSYFVTNGPLVYFGESSGADQWIKRNIKIAQESSAVALEPLPPTEVHPGVLRYLKKEG